MFTESKNGSAFPNGSLKVPKPLFAISYSSRRSSKSRPRESLCPGGVGSPSDKRGLWSDRAGSESRFCHLLLVSRFKSVSRLPSLCHGAEAGFFPRFWPRAAIFPSGLSHGGSAPSMVARQYHVLKSPACPSPQHRKESIPVWEESKTERSEVICPKS